MEVRSDEEHTQRACKIRVEYVERAGAAAHIVNETCEWRGEKASVCCVVCVVLSEMQRTENVLL